MKIYNLVFTLILIALMIAGFILSKPPDLILLILLTLLLGGWLVLIEKREKGRLRVSKVTLILGILAFLSLPIVYFGDEQLDRFLSNFGLDLWIVWLVYVSICLIGVVIDLVFRHIKKRRTSFMDTREIS